MKFKRILTTLMLIGIIYGVGHFYFMQKTPAMLKLAIATIERSGLKVEYTKHKSGNYLFRPYVELATMSLANTSGALPSLRMKTNNPTRFMLNWWQGQSLTITNKGQASIDITYPNFQYSLTPTWLVVTVDKIDTEPSFRELETEGMQIDFVQAQNKTSVLLDSLRATKVDQKSRDSQLLLSCSHIRPTEKTEKTLNFLDSLEVALEVPESIKNPFQAKWFLILAQNKEAILIKKLYLKWAKAVFQGQGNIEIDSEHLPHITLQTSMVDFEVFLENLRGHPLIHPVMLKTWQAVLSILKATSKDKSIIFEYKAHSIYINGIEALKNVDI